MRLSIRGIQADTWLIIRWFYQSTSRFELQHRDYVLPGPRWRKQQQKKSNSLRHIQPCVSGEDELQSTFWGLEVSVKYNALSYLAFRSPSHRSCTCLEQHSILGFFFPSSKSLEHLIKLQEGFWLDLKPCFQEWLILLMSTVLTL